MSDKLFLKRCNTNISHLRGEPMADGSRYTVKVKLGEPMNYVGLLSRNTGEVTSRNIAKKIFPYRSGNDSKGTTSPNCTPTW